MIEAWIVVRKEKHVDDKFWVCLDQEDALRIAASVKKYWFTEYEVDSECVDETCYEDQIFHCDVEDSFRIYVEPVLIREAGEWSSDITVPDKEVGTKGGA